MENSSPPLCDDEEYEDDCPTVLQGFFNLRPALVFPLIAHFQSARAPFRARVQSSRSGRLSPRNKTELPARSAVIFLNPNKAIE